VRIPIPKYRAFVTSFTRIASLASSKSRTFSHPLAARTASTSTPNPRKNPTVVSIASRNSATNSSFGRTGRSPSATPPPDSDP
jgi:hypothetical protein